MGENIKKYPQNKDIEEHKKQVFVSMLQYFEGLVPIENVEAAIKSLMGDAALWVNNNHKELDLDDVKKKIASLKLSI